MLYCCQALYNPVDIVLFSPINRARSVIADKGYRPLISAYKEKQESLSSMFQGQGKGVKMSRKAGEASAERTRAVCLLFEYAFLIIIISLILKVLNSILCH